jgi:hypothetical protein
MVQVEQQMQSLQAALEAGTASAAALQATNAALVAEHAAAGVYVYWPFLCCSITGTDWVHHNVANHAIGC